MLATPMTARLYGGTTEAGLLQISVNGEWTTVCPPRFEQNEIEVTCRMLGFNRSVAHCLLTHDPKQPC